MQGVGLVSPGIASPFGHPNQYYQKVKRIAGSNLLTYWPQWEIVGGVAHDISGNSPAGERDGAYTGVTLAQPGIGDGNLVPLYDGANDFTNVFSVPFRDAFDGQEGSLVVWAIVDGVGVWTDGADRYFINLTVSSAHNMFIHAPVAANTINYTYEANNIVESVNTAFSGINPFMVGMTWSLSAGVDGEFKAYLNGVQVGATQTGLGTWAGLLSASFTLLGAGNQTPLFVWNGRIAHAFPMDRVATPDEMRSFGSLNDD